MRPALLLAALLGACFRPDYPDNLACSLNYTCPPGQFCHPEYHVCISSTPDADVPDAQPLPDAPPDARPDAGPSLFAVAGPDKSSYTGLTLRLDGSASHDQLA